MSSDCSSHSDSDSTTSDQHKSSELASGGDSNEPKKDYKDALEALIHMPTMGLKWSNTVAMHNAICYLSGALRGDESPKTKECSSFHKEEHIDTAEKLSGEEVTKPLPLVKKVAEPSNYVLTGPYSYPPVAINIAPKGYHFPSNMQVNEKEQMRKASHNIIEKRRREKINELTQTLASLVPACQQRDGLHPSRSACSKVIILEKTITYLQQVTAENNKLKRKCPTSQDSSQDSNSVVLQAMQNQIAILEKENEFLRKKLHNYLPDDSTTVDEASTIVDKELEKSAVAISTTELAELKALEMIRKLLDSVQKRHGQGGRVQEALKELSAKKMKLVHACSNSHCNQSSCMFIPNDSSPDKHEPPEAKRKQNEVETGTKKVKIEVSDVPGPIPVLVDSVQENTDVISTVLSADALVNGTVNQNPDN